MLMKRETTDIYVVKTTVDNACSDYPTESVCVTRVNNVDGRIAQSAIESVKAHDVEFMMEDVPIDDFETLVLTLEPQAIVESDVYIVDRTILHKDVDTAITTVTMFKDVDRKELLTFTDSVAEYRAEVLADRRNIKADDTLTLTLRSVEEVIKDHQYKNG